jgi:quercetin dioxygenase-like cupin family protein
MSIRRFNQKMIPLKEMRILLLIFLLFMNNTIQAQLPMVKSGVFHWDELPQKTSAERVGRKIMEGSSTYFEFLEIHATTQIKGAKPSPPHTQENIEEVLIVKEGLMKMTMDGESKTLPAGSVILIPPLVEQSLENIGDGPLTYYVMMFKSKKPMDIERSNAAGGKMFINYDELEVKENARGSRIHYFERATATCEKFEMHVTQLNEKGPSHQPHAHKDTEIILVIEGETEMTIDGKKYEGKAGDLYLMNANEMHGISNAGNTPAKYFAFRWY